MTAVAAFGLSLLMIESPATPPGTVFASAMIAEVDSRPADRLVSIFLFEKRK